MMRPPVIVSRRAGSTAMETVARHLGASQASVFNETRVTGTAESKAGRGDQFGSSAERLG